MTATAKNTEVDKGDNIEVTFNITTLGPDDAYNVVLTSSMPATTTFVSAIPSQGICLEAVGTIRCVLRGPLASSDPGYSVTMIFDTTASGTVTVAACAEADDNDIVDTNNEASVAIEVKKKSSSGGLCSYDPNAVFDPILPAIVFLGLIYMGFRRKLKVD